MVMINARSSSDIVGGPRCNGGGSGVSSGISGSGELGGELGGEPGAEAAICVYEESIYTSKI